MAALRRQAAISLLRLAPSVSYVREAALPAARGLSSAAEQSADGGWMPGWLKARLPAALGGGDGSGDDYEPMTLDSERCCCCCC